MQTREMEESLDSLQSLQGMIGAAVWDSGGVMLAHSLRPPYEPLLLERAREQMSLIGTVYSSMEPENKLRYFFARFQEMVVLWRHADVGSLMVLASSSVNQSMLSVAANAVMTRMSVPPRVAPGAGTIPGVPAPQGSLPPVAAGGTFLGGMQESAIPPVVNEPILRASLVPAPLPARPSLPPTPVVPSFPGLPSGGGTPVSLIGTPPPMPVEDGVPIEVTRELVTRLAVYLGPVAKVVVKNAITELGATPSTLRKVQWSQLVARVAGMIRDAQGRADFLSAAERLRPR